MAAVHLRPATSVDLVAINAVIECAVMTWQLPERVKRLALPTYRYHPYDLEHLKIVVAEYTEQGVIGVAAWEPANPRDQQAGQTGLLLHGLYVDPSWQSAGVGTRLLDAAIATAREHGFDGLLVKAQPEAAEFFLARGLERLARTDPERDYPHRFWKSAVRSG